MPNKITYTVQATNTTKPVEYWNPFTNAYQDTNPLTGIPAGSYSGLKARLKGSNPSIIATYTGSVIVVDSTTTNKIALVGIGDSIERADQATNEAGFDVSPSNQQANTTTFQSANGATGNQGRQTSTERAVDILNINLGSSIYDAYTVGYPGKTSFYFRRNYLTNFFSTFDFTKYDEVVVKLAFGANDLIFPDQQGDSVDPIAIADNIIFIANTLKSVNSKIKIFISPTLNRTYNNPSPNGPQQSEFVNFDDKRQTLNNSLLTRLNTYAVGAVNIFNQPIGLANMPFNYPNAEVSDGSHPTVKGQGEIALEIARTEARRKGYTLTQGSSNAPTPPALPSGPVTQVVNYKLLNNVIQNADKSLTSQNGGTAFNHYGVGDRAVESANNLNTTIKFNSITRRVSTDARGIFLAFSGSPVEAGVTTGIDRVKYGLYSDGSTLRLFVNGAYLRDITWIAAEGSTTSLSIVYNPPALPQGVYFYEGSTQIDYIGDSSTTDLYVYALAGEDGLTIPAITITAPKLNTY